MMNCANQYMEVEFIRLISKLNRKTGREERADPEFLKSRDLALVELKPLRPIVVCTYPTNADLGAFVLTNSNKTVAIGLITAVSTDAEKSKRH